MADTTARPSPEGPPRHLPELVPTDPAAFPGVVLAPPVRVGVKK